MPDDSWMMIMSIEFLRLQNSVRQVLEAVIEFGGEGVDGLLNHRVNKRVKLIFCEVQVEPLFHALNG